MKNLIRSFLLTFSSAAFALKSGDPAPEFSAPNQNGKAVSLSDPSLKGKYVLLYFYPKDNTSGCTREAQEFRDLHDDFVKANTVILGVSRQDEKSHQGFATAQKLPFDLLADTNGDLAKKYEIGSIPILGWSKRQSVLIGPDAKIARVYTDVDPEKHAKEVLAEVQKTKQ